MAYDWCVKCAAYHGDRHSPIFEVWDTDGAELPDFEPYIVEVYATHAEDAAEKWAEREDWNSAEYSIVKGDSSPTIAVREKGTETIVFYIVTGESVPNYMAEETTVPLATAVSQTADKPRS